ncbi:MAG: hypothetical protein HXY23_08230 [Parvularculaceae bacterium]|nr:hypothetical protein [Parvularculaceae bacterium]
MAVPRRRLPHAPAPPGGERACRPRRASWTLGVVALLLSACAPAGGPAFDTDGLPEKLSEWGVLSAHDGVLEFSDGAMPYDLATPLFSDYALKLRTVSLPPGTSATYHPDEAFDFPVGTIVTKTFYYPVSSDGVAIGPERSVETGVLPLDGLRLIETRILHRRAEGWIALPYVWNPEQTDAVLKRAGDFVETTLYRPDGRAEPLNYFIPNANQCAGCHATDNTTRAIQPIGLKARHLNKPSSFAPTANQLDLWRLSGLLAGNPGGPAPRNAVWTDESEGLDARARAYLDVNCSHCHSDVGPADTSGLDLRPETPMGPKVGLCKGTIAAGAGSGGRPYDIVPAKPDESILLFRLQTADPAAMMPELGRSVVHEEGVALIQRWIEGMAGSCD